uniref:Uncharacterized protein n=1 Tax=Timema shepardi TaxID=629360 RepID=A0A7R9ALC3_TIMSH|nr:unnamed protein product [Timema shepardi]
MWEALLHDTAWTTMDNMPPSGINCYTTQLGPPPEIGAIYRDTFLHDPIWATTEYVPSGRNCYTIQLGPLHEIGAIYIDTLLHDPTWATMEYAPSSGRNCYTIQLVTPWRSIDEGEPAPGGGDQEESMGDPLTMGTSPRDAGPEPQPATPVPASPLADPPGPSDHAQGETSVWDGQLVSKLPPHFSSYPNKWGPQDLSTSHEHQRYSWELGTLYRELCPDFFVFDSSIHCKGDVLSHSSTDADNAAILMTDIQELLISTTRYAASNNDKVSVPTSTSLVKLGGLRSVAGGHGGN